MYNFGESSAGRSEQELCTAGSGALCTWHAAAARFIGRQAGCDGSGGRRKLVGGRTVHEVEARCRMCWCTVLHCSRQDGWSNAGRESRKQMWGQINRWRKKAHRRTTHVQMRAWDLGHGAGLLATSWGGNQNGVLPLALKEAAAALLGLTPKESSCKLRLLNSNTKKCWLGSARVAGAGARLQQRLLHLRLPLRVGGGGHHKL